MAGKIIRVKDPNGAEGDLHVAELPEWEAKGKGYEAVSSKEEIAAAREEAGITPEAVTAAKEQAKATAGQGADASGGAAGRSS